MIVLNDVGDVEELVDLLEDLAGAGLSRRAAMQRALEEWQRTHPATELRPVPRRQPKPDPDVTRWSITPAGLALLQGQR